MSKAHKSKTLIYSIALVSILITTSSVISAQAKHPVLQKGNFIWHWHLGTPPGNNVLKDIEKLSIKGVFLHVGEFSYYHDQFQFRSLNLNREAIHSLKKNKNLQLHLTFTFSGGSHFPFLRQFHKKTPEAISFVIDTIHRYISSFSYLNISLGGIQLDMEGKIDLGKYKLLVDAVEKEFGDRYLISITPPTYWYGKKGFKALIERVDFFVPMLYDYQKSKRVSGITRVTDSRWMERWIKKFNTLDKPFYAGIPTYSYSIIYDHQGKRIEPWAQAYPESLSQNPDFKLSQTSRANMSGTKKYDGDNVYIFEALRDTTLDKNDLKKGAKVKINIVTPRSITRYIKKINGLKTHNLTGISLFRYGYDRENLVAGKDEIGSALNGNSIHTLNPAAEILYNKREHPSLNIGDTITFTLLLNNKGTKESYCTNNSNHLMLTIKNGRIRSYHRGDFEDAKQTAEGIIFKEYLLDKKEVVISGNIQVTITRFPLEISYQGTFTDLDSIKEIPIPEKSLTISQ